MCGLFGRIIWSSNNEKLRRIIWHCNVKYIEKGVIGCDYKNFEDVYAQLMKQPYVEVSTSSPTFAWIHLSGKAVFVDDLAIKAKIIEISPLVKEVYGRAENPIFEIFYLDEVKAVIVDFSGNAPQKYTL